MTSADGGTPILFESQPWTSEVTEYPKIRQILEEDMDLGLSKFRYDLCSSLADQRYDGITPKVLFHFVRHAEAEHNVPNSNSRTIDPPLTKHGLAQASHLTKTFPGCPLLNIDLILCSPMKRTRQTCYLGFKPVIDAGKKVRLWDQLKEWGNSPASTGRAKENLRSLSENTWDLRMVHEGWEKDFSGAGTGTDKTQTPRVLRVRAELFRLGEVMIKGGQWKHFTFNAWKAKRDVNVVVVSHANFLSSLLGFQKPNFYNIQVRSCAHRTKAQLTKWENSRSDDNSLLQTGQSLLTPHKAMPLRVIPPKDVRSKLSDNQIQQLLRNVTELVITEVDVPIGEASGRKSDEEKTE